MLRCPFKPNLLHLRTLLYESGSRSGKLLQPLASYMLPQPIAHLLALHRLNQRTLGSELPS